MAYNKNMTHEKAINKVTDYIMDMQYKDQWNEINWLLSNVYPKEEFDKLMDEWAFTDRGEVGEQGDVE